MKDRLDFKQTRIGNYVYFTVQPPYSDKKYIPCVILGGISWYKAFVKNLTRYGHTFVLLETAGHPIDLTEEWLLKLGFKPFCKDFVLNGIIIHRRKRGWVLKKSVPIIRYVHQLQNLYYCLTGEELFIKNKC